MEADVQRVIADAWPAKVQPSPLPRLRFWESPVILRHINQTLCGEVIDGAGEGGLRLLSTYHQEKTGRPLPVFERGLSIGAGCGGIEMELITRGLVRHFDLFELSPKRIEVGEAAARERGLADRIHYHEVDFFDAARSREKVYDLVFWQGALHHMMDAFQAVLTSRAVLKEGGVFYCNDFVGATRFQWSDEELKIVNDLRGQLFREDRRLFELPQLRMRIQVPIGRSTVEEMLASDPSEAADSSNILPAVKRFFPQAHIVHSGGLIYHLCLNGLLTNIPEESPLLQRLLRQDDHWRKAGFLHYAVIMAIKEND